MEKLIESIIESISTSNSNQTRRKLSVIKKQLGVLRLKQARIDELNDFLTKCNIAADPKLITGISDETSITFKPLNAVTPTVSSLQEKVQEKAEDKSVSKDQLPKITAPEDFFKHLFFFESDNGYDKFQACLDSNSPIALFIIPKADNSFYSSVIPKILSYELIRKRQYKLNTSGFQSEPLVKPTTKVNFDNGTDRNMSMTLRHSLPTFSVFSPRSLV